MIDGLALGETTPGPLIMVVAFVGFVGGYVKAVFGPDSLFLAGAVAASPGHLVHLPALLHLHPGRRAAGRTTHNDLKFTAPLTAITAAVVGVILNLALFFGYHVDPTQIGIWADELPKDQDIVLYCVRGGGVSNSVVDALQAKGLNARFIEGGIEGWKAAGGAVVGK
jgi:rhodanese-related sulfurtransferase